jgi:diacylglycerol kinase (ATP)
LPAVHVLANPNAQSGRGARGIPLVERALQDAGWNPVVYRTQAPGDARRHVADLVRGASPAPVVVLGGDGTLHEVVNGLADAGFPDGFPLVPRAMGTGNDFHRMLHGKQDGISGLLDVLERGRVRRFDVGHVEWEGGRAHFVNLLGVGIDVEVLRLRERYPNLPGLLQYGAALLAALRVFRPPDVRLTWVLEHEPEQEVMGPVLLAAATVGPTVGGGFVLAPDASPEDGLLDLFLAKPMPLRRLLRHLPGVVRGTNASSDEIRRLQFSTATLTSMGPEPLFFELDGERMGTPSPWLQISLQRGRLPVMDDGSTRA